jgi:hypothetical protein
MRSPPNLVPLLFVTTFLADFAACVSVDRLNGVNVPAAIWYTLIISQISLVAVWLGLGTTPFLARALLLGGLAYLFIIIMDVKGHRNVSDWPSLFGLQAAVIATPLSFMRWRGIAVIRTTILNPVHATRPLQFSLRSMLAGVTAIAVVLGAARVFPWEAVRGIYDVLVFAAAFAATALVAVWSGFGSGPLLLRLAVLMLVPALVGLAIAWIQEQRPPRTDDEYMLIGIVSVQAILCGLSLMVIRLSGYELVRPLRMDPTAASTDGKTA